MMKVVLLKFMLVVVFLILILPEGTISKNIDCREDDDCPPGMICIKSRGECVAKEQY